MKSALQKREYEAAWRQAHRDQLRERDRRRYVGARVEKARERSRKRYAAEREKLCERGRQYYATHREQMNESARRWAAKWKAENPAEFSEYHRRYKRRWMARMKAENPGRYRDKYLREQTRPCPVHFCTNRKNRRARLCVECSHFLQWLGAGKADLRLIEVITLEDRTAWQNLRNKRQSQALRKMLSTTLQSQIFARKPDPLRSLPGA